MDDDPLTSPSFPAINASDSRSYRSRRSSGAHSVPQTGQQPATGRPNGYPDPTTEYPVPAHGGQPQQTPAANPYGSYVSASQPAYQDVAPSLPEAPAYGGSYGNGVQPDGSWYGGANPGYPPTNGNGHNGNGQGYPARGQHQLQSSYGAIDYQTPPYQDQEYGSAPSAAGGNAAQHPPAGQFDERGYGVPDLAYGQDGYQAYPGYGPRSR